MSKYTGAQSPNKAVSAYDNVRENTERKIDGTLSGMNERHCKVLPVRADFRFPKGYAHNGKNEEISRFHKNLNAQMKKKGIDYDIVTVREQNTSSNPHYHAMAFYDGNKVQNPKAIKHRMAKIWQRILKSECEGLVDFCKHKQGYKFPPLEMIQRPSLKAEGEELTMRKEQFDRSIDIARQHGAYLTKTHSKGEAGNSRELLGSQRR